MQICFRRTARNIALLLLTCTLASAAPLHLARGPFGSGRAHVTASFDGHDQLCVLDTGSLLSIAADPDTFAAYPAFGEIRFQSAAGIPISGDKIKIATLNLDRRTFRDITVARVEPGNKIRSTIGLNLLALQPFTLLFRDEASLYLGRHPLPGQSSTLKVFPPGTFTIPVTTKISAELAVWDTGAELTAVDRAYVAAHPQLFSSARDIGSVTDGTDRSLSAQLWKLNELRIGTRTFKNIRVLAVDFSTIHQATDQTVHFVIGFNIIRNADWHFDIPRRTWTVR